MEGFNLLSVLTLLGAAHGVFLALALVNTSTGDLKAHRILAFFTATFALDLGEEFLYQTGFFESYPNLLNLLAPIDLFYGPLIYLYVVQLTTRTSSTRAKAIWHFIPVIPGIVLLSPFYILGGDQKLALTEAVRTGTEMVQSIPNISLIEIGFTVFILGTVFQIGLYLVLSLRRLVVHRRAIQDEFSDIDKINLGWLRNLLVGFGCIFLLYLGDQFFPDLWGMNVLGDMITLVAVVMIYAMGYLGLRQPQIFSQPLTSSIPVEGIEQEEPKSKYERSGLDKDTSEVFLQELSTHMEENKPYLDGDLVLPRLAEELGISPNYLSQIINEQLNVNFYDFINGYRVEEAKRLLNKDTGLRINVLNLALDSGFNSKSAFYSAFKKSTSMTPTQFRKTLTTG